MIFELLTGRIGNQMFQYATMRAIQEKYFPNDNIMFLLDDMKKSGREEDGFYNQLYDFKINKEIIESKDKCHLSTRQIVLLAKYYIHRKMIKLTSKKEDYELRKKEYENKIQTKYNRNGLYLFSYGYYPFKATKQDNKLFLGFFESPKYFDSIRDKLLNEFEPVANPLECNKKMYQQIADNESVCVSVRRGDYINTKFENSAYICTPKYFEDAIAIIKEKVKNPKFIVFSDDIKWVRDNIKFPEGTIYETGKDPVWEKMRLMYSCKHFIISNSTFSWWAQYLSRNNNKVVIAPSKWRKDGYDGRDLYMKNWILIDTQRLDK